ITSFIGSKLRHTNSKALLFVRKILHHGFIGHAALDKLFFCFAFTWFRNRHHLHLPILLALSALLRYPIAEWARRHLQSAPYSWPPYTHSESLPRDLPSHEGLI